MRRAFRFSVIALFALFALFRGGAAQAQLPPEAERFPQAPALPGGEVVSKPLGTARPVAHGVALNIKPAMAVEDLPLPSVPPKPTANYVTATVMPVAPPASPYAHIVSPHPGDPNCAPCTKNPCPTGCPSAGCSTCGACKTCPQFGMGDIDLSKHKEWLKFQSTSRHEGCQTSQGQPALHTWFNCKPKWGSCGGVSGCATGCNTGCQTGGTHAVPQPMTVASPYGHPTAAPILGHAEAIPPAKVAEDTLSSFRTINGGIGFTPGGSPMAAPVTGPNYTVPVKGSKIR
jgi:hypothetical protein